MKKVLIVSILTFLFAGNIFSQDSSKSNEIGIFFSNTYNFGIRYKHGGENLKFRVTALEFNWDSNKDEYYDESETKYESDGIGFGLNFGLEFPISITEQLNFYCGPEIGGKYRYSERKYDYDSNDHVSYSRYLYYGIGLIVGFAYKLNSDFIVSAEIVPSFYYSYRKSSTDKHKTYSFDFTNDYAGITVGYRF